ncbi:hypothetical protein [Actinophytocola glycyrrhizae]|uniref:Uncharacterized protein n=1 Tax=Actinophytocola glycyrrhizae TaxID=2044873 RepID=A0ABV9SCB4_9PSEU
MAAADPTAWFDEDDLQHLPDIAEADRALTRLAANMATTSVGGFSDRDMATLAAENASRVGLQLRYGDDERVVVKQDATPEGRRRRLWGDAWIEDGVPGLPTADELASLLSSRGVPASTTDAVAEATRGRRRRRGAAPGE